MKIINKILGIESPSKRCIESLINTYSCDTNKNDACNKRNCSKKYCNRTTQYKYAKKTIINYIKKIINKMRNRYKYE